MKITFLGTGTSQGVPMPLCECPVCLSENPKNKRLRSSLFVEYKNLNILIDTSVDFRQQMLRHNIRRIDSVLITHHHFDHLYGLDDIRAFTNAQKEIIDVYTKPDVIPEIMTRFGYAFHEQNLSIGLPALRMHAVQSPFQIRQNGTGLTITPIEVLHGLISIYGYRIENFAYVTDCKSIPDASVALLQDLDVLIIEALRHRMHPTHASLEEALGFIERINPKKAYLTHFSHEMDHEELESMLPDHVYAAYDMLELRVPKNG